MRKHYIYGSTSSLAFYTSHLEIHKPFESERPGEVTDIWTTFWPEGYIMDIKLVNGDAEGGGPWAEAVLFYKGSEVAHSEPRETLTGEWTLEHNGETFTVELQPK